jgi:hypothetical protein
MDDAQSASDIHDLTVGRAIDEAIAWFEDADLDHALDALERAVDVSESHPRFSKRASSEFQRLERLALLCERASQATERPTTRVSHLLHRIRTLKRAIIH